MPRVTVAVAATGDQVLVAAPGPGLFIRVLGGEISSATAQATVSLKSGASTVLWQTLGLNTTNSAVDITVDKENTLDCNINEALNANNAGTGNVRFNLEYVIQGKPTLPY